MFSFYSLRTFQAFCFSILFFVFFQVGVLGQATYRITKPIIGTTQICSSSSNYYNYMSYAFSSDVVNSSGYSVQHNIELSNENGLIAPRNVSYSYPSPNQINTGSFDVNSLNLPSGGGYRIRMYSSSPLVYGDYSEAFSVLASPATPTLNISGSVTLCPGVPQSLTVTNPNNAYTYQWQNYSSSISNATSTTYSTSSSGSYSVKITSSNGCSVVSNSVYVSQPSALNSSFQTYSNNSSNYYSPLFLKSDQAFRLSAYLNGGKPPYNFTLNDGSTNTSETNISYSKDYSFVAPSNGRKVYTMTTLTDGCGSQLNNSSVMVVRINNSKYCSGANGGTAGIKNFSIQGTTINNINSGKATDGWGEYLTPANIYANQNYNFSITSIEPTSRYFAIWADLNQNGNFEATERIFPSDNNLYQNFTGSFSGTLKLPSSTFNGQTRLRVNLSNYYYNVSSCSSSVTNGETEDYTLNVFNGVNPSTIVTDSLPRLGVCYGKDFPVNFRVLGTQMPANTVYKVEVSNYENFSYTNTLATGTSSPIICNTANTPSTSFYYPLYVRVVPTNISPTHVIQSAPNQLKVNSPPSIYLNSFVVPFSNYPYNIPYSAYDKNIQTTSSVPITVLGNVGSTNPPVEFEMNDGRIFTNNNSNATIIIDSDILIPNNKTYKVVRVSDKVCTNNTSDSVKISIGIPSIEILKVKATNDPRDTTSIDKLCGSLYVTVEAKYIDGPVSSCVFLQISDVNGSFNNPKEVVSGFSGYTCFDQTGSGTSAISCTIDGSLGLPDGNGYRLRLVRKINGNIITISSVFPTIFELRNPRQAPIALSLTKSIINEGETTTLSATFSGGLPPYGIALDYPYYLTAYYTNNTNLSINLNPINSKRYPVFQTNGCGYFYETNLSPLYINVRTRDRYNDQWYIKPFQSFTSGNDDILNVGNLINGTDTIFRKPFYSYVQDNDIKNGYFDYNSDLLFKQATILRVGANYSFHQIVNVRNPYSSSGYNNNTPFLTGIWMDLNQDGDFDDLGEELIKNGNGSPWMGTQIQSFTIPNNANVGFTRLRVRTVKKDIYGNETNTFNASNPINYYTAMTFDIPVVLFSNSVTSIISTPKIAGNTLCNGNDFYVDYSKYGIPTGTNAEVQLSDVYGNFTASPPVIGQGTDASINVTLPMNISSGNYKIRVVSNGIISPVSSSFNVTANTLASMVDGDWHAGSTWSCGRVPTVVDDVTVSAGTNITVFSGDARVGSLITNGVLSFLNGTQLKFKVP
jgi:hypothetical protein